MRVSSKFPLTTCKLPSHEDVHTYPCPMSLDFFIVKMDKTLNDTSTFSCKKDKNVSVATVNAGLVSTSVTKIAV